MAIKDDQVGHRIESRGNQETTVRLTGDHLDTLRAWALESQVSGIFEAVALTFGFTENFTIIGNLCRELSNTESQTVLEQWSDNPYVAQLSRLAVCYKQSAVIATAYAGIPQSGTRSQTKTVLRDAGAQFEKKHFLLEMIVNPPPHALSRNANPLRRYLRIWLIVQALQRTVNHHCYHDKQVQIIASSLSLDTNNLKWEMIDRLLERANQKFPNKHFTFEQFTLAVQYASTQLQPSYPNTTSRGIRRVLDAARTVAEGHCNPIQGQKEDTAPFTPSFDGILPEHGHLSFSKNDLSTNQALVYVDPDNSQADEEDLEQSVWIEVDSDDTPERQRLSGRSVLLQSAELSHYLPWSWEKALPPEVIDLENWLDEALKSPDLGEKLGAAITWLAIHFARSLDFTLEFAITDVPEPEWSLSKDFSRAHRHPPKRHHSWSPSGHNLLAIEAFAEPLDVILPKRICDVLRSSYEAYDSHAKSLHDLWVRAHQVTPRMWFDGHAKKHFSRLSSAKLANIQPQRVFSQTVDHSLARLISAHPSAALPAACGYANWDIREVQSGFALKLQKSSDTSERVNLLGSLLAPLETLLVDGIGKANDNLSVSFNDDPIAFHNNLVEYTVMALYAATGCRHLSEPFESISHFCDEIPAVFINDKSDDGIHNGRLVPLADGAFAIFNAYRTHLRQLCEPLQSLGNTLAQRIEDLLAGKSSSLPLFFLLDSYGQWHTLNDEDLPGNKLFDWPLPKNLFRHRFAQQLARCHVTPEVIDGWMGHGERGAASYGDHSPRCWTDDAKRYRPILNACFDQLGFITPPEHSSLNSLALKTEPALLSYAEPSIFGQAKRAQKRRRARDEARLSARKSLEFYRETNPCDELTQDYVDNLARKMLMRENGLPHSYASIRMEVLIQWLEDSKSENRRFIHHRLARLQSERSLLRSSCLNAFRLMPTLQQWVQETKLSIRQTRFSKGNALALGAFFFAIEKLISYPKMIEDLIQGKNYRVIQHDQRVFLEYSELLEPEDFDQPIQRHQIDHTTGRLLAQGLGIKTTIVLDTTYCPKPLLTLVNILESAEPDTGTEQPVRTLAWLLKKLLRTVEQKNLIELPGVVAAALSERNPSTSICLYDYLRLTEGKRYQIPDSMDEEGSLEHSTLPSIPAMASSLYPKAFYDSATSFFQKIQDILNQYTKSGALKTAKIIEQHCKAASHSVSSAVVLVGYWIAHRVRKGKGKHGQNHDPYAANSIKRYLGALTTAFKGIASDADLMTMSEEEITGLCAQMLTLHAGKLKDLSYFSARLIEFFNWASKLGVSTPDWDELDLGSSRRSVRPRLFSEAEYLLALNTLLQPNGDNSDRGMLGAFVLLLCYRFGLRAWEAIGLMRRDWCQAGELTWVLVQNNSIRSLKYSRGSRRAVPLMFELTQVEHTLIQSVLERYITQLGDSTNKPILYEWSNNRVTLTAYARLIPADIANALKRVTGNRQMSLHQARHAFCNVLTAALFDIPTPLTTSLTTSLDAPTIRQIILGNQELPSRRCAMAIARALGHQTPSTQFRSYNHLLLEWADHLTPVDSHYISRIPNVVFINAWSIDEPISEVEQTTIFSHNAVLRPAIVIKAMRLISLGYATDAIERILRLQSGDLANLEIFVDRINAGMRFKVFDPEKGKKGYVYGKTLPKHLLKSRPADVWPRLLLLSDRLPSRNELNYELDLPTLDEASNYIGRNGHLLMNDVKAAHLCRLIVKSFNLPQEAYIAITRGKPNEIARPLNILDAGEFRLASDSSIQLDSFNANYDVAFPRHRAYAGMVHAKPAISPFNDGTELVLAFIAVTAAYCPQATPLSPYATIDDD